MTLTTARANEKTAAIKESFEEIGNAGDTAMPKGTRNNIEHLAWEILVSDLLQSAAVTRAKKARTAGIKAGVMFDHKKHPDEAETARVVYNGDLVRIDLTVGTGRDGIDHDAFVAFLLKAKVDAKLLARAAVNCATTTAPPHKLECSLVTV